MQMACCCPKLNSHWKVVRKMVVAMARMLVLVQVVMVRMVSRLELVASIALLASGSGLGSGSIGSLGHFLSSVLNP